MSDKLANRWLSVGMIVGLIVGVPVFAYSNFVTIRDGDAIREITLDRISSIENNQKTISEQIYELKGKIDTLVFVIKQEKDR